MTVSPMGYNRSLIGFLLLLTLVYLSASDVFAGGATRVVNTRYAALVINSATGDVLHAENANARRYPASLTKMMTLYLLFESLRAGKISLDSMMPVSRYAATKPQTNLFLRAGDKITVRDAIYALIIRSANDVAVVVAERLGRTESQFANMMTQKARQLGMNSTVFRNANGLPDSRQYTTARDMVVLAMALKKHFPQYYPLFKTRQFTFRGRTYFTHNNAMVRLPGADGLKTGFINASGFNVVTSATRNGQNLVGAVMGGRTGYTRDNRMIALMEQSFAQLNKGASSQYAGGRVNISQTSPAKPAFVSLPLPAAKPSVLTKTIPPQAPHPQPLQAPQTASQRYITEPVEPSIGYIAAPNQPLAQQVPAPGQFMANNTATEAPIPPTKAWEIQVGAYYRAPEAIMAATNASHMAVNELVGAQIKVSNGIEPSSGLAIHRARLGNLDERQAHQACQKLISMRQSCFVIRPEQS